MLYSDTFIDTGMALKWRSTKDLCILRSIAVFMLRRQ